MEPQSGVSEILCTRGEVMKVWTTITIAVALMCASCSAPGSPSGIVVEGAWIAAPSGNDVASGFATIRNPGGRADRLLGAATRRASMAMLHDMTITNGVVAMRAAPSGFPIAAGSEMVLSPQGAHIMLMGISPPLKEGEPVQMELTFEKAGRVVAPFVVGAKQPASAHTTHP
jgi:copper(I)-binding protein